MRIRNLLVVSAGALTALVLTGCTPVQDPSFGNARLGLQGASVTIPLTVRCQAGWNIAYGDAYVVQADGDKLAQGAGSFSNAYPGVPCTTGPQTMTIAVFDSSPWVFGTGSAAARGDLTVYNPATGELVTSNIDPQAMKIVRTDPQPNPSMSAQATVDVRYTRK
jgi:hypothetical protein